MSPIQYLKFLRMERAKHLLETSFLSVKEITYSVGLNDESHFARDFKRAYGVPPTSYRTLFREEQLNKSDDEIKPHHKIEGLIETAKRSILPPLSFVTYLLSRLDGTL